MLGKSTEATQLQMTNYISDVAIFKRKQIPGRTRQVVYKFTIGGLGCVHAIIAVRICVHSESCVSAGAKGSNTQAPHKLGSITAFQGTDKLRQNPRFCCYLLRSNASRSWAPFLRLLGFLRAPVRCRLLESRFSSR